MVHGLGLEVGRGRGVRGIACEETRVRLDPQALIVLYLGRCSYCRYRGRSLVLC